MNISEKEFAQVVREHKNTIYTVCYMFSNDADEVADLFQEVLINLWQGFANFKKHSNVKTWIYRVAFNTCISADRKKKRRAAAQLDMNIDLFDEKSSDRNLTTLLHSRISRLKPFDRAIVLLWLEDMSYDEIGAIIGITTKNVSVRLYRIKEELKKM